MVVPGRDGQGEWPLELAPHTHTFSAPDLRCWSCLLAWWATRRAAAGPSCPSALSQLPPSSPLLCSSVSSSSTACFAWLVARSTQRGSDPCWGELDPHGRRLVLLGHIPLAPEAGQGYGGGSLLGRPGPVPYGGTATPLVRRACPWSSSSAATEVFGGSVSS
jgi:hypothetical protein